MSSKVTTIATGLLIVAVLALGGLLLLTHQASTAAVSRASAQISRQAKMLAHQATQIASLQTHLAATQQLARVATHASQGAAAAHLGICVAASENSADSYGDTYTALQSYDITSPHLSAGVASCPTGSFVSVVPSKH